MKIVLTREVNDRLDQVVALCKGEVGGLGYARVEDEDTIIVDEIFLVPQQVSSGGVDFDSDAISIAIEKAIEDDRLNDLRFSWHSHGNLGVFWSSTDEGGIRDYLEGGAPWLASMVVNHKGDTKARLDIARVPKITPNSALQAALTGKNEFEFSQVTFDDLDVDVAAVDGTLEWAEAQIAENVRQRQYNWNKGNKNNSNLQSTTNQKSGSATSSDKKGSKDTEQDKLSEFYQQLAGAVEIDPDELADGFTVITAAGPAEFTAQELQKLTEHGYDLKKMSFEDIIDAIMTIDINDDQPLD